MRLGTDADADRFFGGAGFERKDERKLRQLCRQVERAAALSLDGDWLSDAVLACVVAEVVPAPDARRLMVVVALMGDPSDERLAAVRAALARAAGAVREEVARAIHRKRVPELVFDVRWEGTSRG